MGKANESKTLGLHQRDMTQPEKERRFAAAISRSDARKSRAEAGAKSGPRKKSSASPTKARRKKD